MLKYKHLTHRIATYDISVSAKRTKEITFSTNPDIDKVIFMTTCISNKQHETDYVGSSYRSQV